LSKTINLKLGVYGEGSVGKTSLINVFLGKEVPTEYSPTLNSEVSKKEYILKKTGLSFKLNIWDVGGNRAVNPIINKAFFSEVDLALIVFDLTRTDLTLKSHEKNFLDRINQYSEEEPLTLIVGNKLDKLLLNNDFKKAVQNHLGEKKSFSITSATSELNVNICFELLIYTFLKKSEILLPDLVPENSSLEFIELIGKTEEELRGHLVNLNSIDLKHRDLKPKLKKADIPSQEEDKEKKYNEFIRQELIKISNQKSNLKDKFLENITEMGEKLNQLKKQNIKSSPEVVEKLKISLESSKKNCEHQLEALIKLNREENELLIISSKVRENKLADLQKKVQISQKVKEPTPRSKLPEVKIRPKPQPKPLEVKVKPQPKPKPLEDKVKPQSKLNLSEFTELLKKVPKPLEIGAKSKPEPELKPIEVKAKLKPAPKPPEVKVKLKPVPKLVKDKAKLKSVPKTHEIKAKLKPVPKSPEVKDKAKPKPKLSRLKEVKLVSKPIKKDPKIESYNEYESIHPGKRAIFRGKETKGFLEWKKKQKA